MFYSITGKFTYMESGFVVVECGGVGFKCLTSLNTQRMMPKIGEEVKLFTYLSVREDALDLFGFSSQAELNAFKLLISVSGVGAKVGLAILSELTPEKMVMAAAAGDVKSFTRAAGVGNKLAQRVVLELKDKVKNLSFGEGMQPADIAAAGVVSASANAEKAVEALGALGYAPSDAAAVVGKLDSSLPVEELIRQALKAMASRF